MAVSRSLLGYEIDTLNDRSAWKGAAETDNDGVEAICGSNNGIIHGEALPDFVAPNVKTLLQCFFLIKIPTTKHESYLRYYGM